MMVVLSSKVLVYIKAVKKIYISIVDQIYSWFYILFQTHYYTLPCTPKQRKIKFKPTINKHNL